MKYFCKTLQLRCFVGVLDTLLFLTNSEHSTEGIKFKKKINLNLEHSCLQGRLKNLLHDIAIWRSQISLQVFLRLSSSNFTFSILEYLKVILVITLEKFQHS